MSEIIHAVPEPHRCHIGYDHDATDYAVGSIAQCECGRYFKCTHRETMFGSCRGWTPVYWWNFNARSRIKIHETKPSEGEL